MKSLAELELMLTTTTDPTLRAVIEGKIQKMKLSTQAAGGDEVAAAIVAMRQVLETMDTGAAQTVGGAISKAEVDKMVADYLDQNKIGINQLDATLARTLTGTTRVKLELTVPEGAGTVTKVGGATLGLDEVSRPLFQRLLSDLISQNNVYLYGGAGTGKTFIVEQLAKFLNYDFVLLSCNQFTSQLDILGGQTIKGYQLGKLEMAWGNLNADGQPNGKNGSILCLDELPKIDPNTAGILNEALAKLKTSQGGLPPTIINGRNQTIPRGNLFVVGTGNTKLNETSSDYEANFRQDLSLQDRFIGSTYEVLPDYDFEFNSPKILKGFAFLWLALVKLREKIIELRLTGYAFVSLRIMIALRDTYITYRKITDTPLSARGGVQGVITNPKTLKDGIDSFLNLFKPDQITELKKAMNYDDFLRTIAAKNKLPLDGLDTPSEIKEAQKFIDQNKQRIAKSLS